MSTVGAANLLAIASHRERVQARRLAKHEGVDFDAALVQVLARLAPGGSLGALVTARLQLRCDADARRARRAEAARRALEARQRARQPDLAIWNAWFDGSAMPNPGRIALGGLLRAPDGREFTLSRDGGEGDSNQAEYLALIAVLRLAVAMRVSHLAVHGDSQIVIADVLGTAALPVAALGASQAQARELMAAFASVSVQWIPRARNAGADALARQAQACAMASAALDQV